MNKNSVGRWHILNPILELLPFNTQVLVTYMFKSMSDAFLVKVEYVSY